MSFIYKYETSTLTPFAKPSDILNLAIQNIFYAQSYVESSFMYNPGLTIFIILMNKMLKICSLPKRLTMKTELRHGQKKK